MSTIKVKAAPGRLLLDILRSTSRNRHYVGLRECRRDAEGKLLDEPLHKIAAAPGIDIDSKGDYVGQSSDLFVSGFPVNLTNLDSNGDEIVVEVPTSGPFGQYIRTALASGDLLAA